MEGIRTDKNGWYSSAYKGGDDFIPDGDIIVVRQPFLFRVVYFHQDPSGMGIFYWDTLTWSGGKHISTIKMYIVYQISVSLAGFRTVQKQQWTEILKHSKPTRPQKIFDY